MNIPAKISGIEIVAVSSCVPSNYVDTKDISYFTPEDAAKFTKNTGITRRHIATETCCSSDLAVKAAQAILEKSHISADKIDILILITQTPDYQIPNTSSLVQHRLNLKKSTVTFDVNLGCSGYVYGLGIAASMLKTLNLKNALLVTVDTLSKTANQNDRSVWPLFGDGATASLLVNNNSSAQMSFDFNTDGSGANAIISKGSGHKETIATPSLELDSIGIFNFALREVPKSIQGLLESSNSSVESISYFVLHQANKVINETIRKKIQASVEQFPNSLETYGNTSSSTIPLTMSHNFSTIQSDQKLVFSGFGVGLSWASVLIENMNIKVLPVDQL